MTSVQLTLLSDVMACMSVWYSLSLFLFFFTFATFTVPDSLALVSFFIRLSCVFSVTSCFIKASNQQPHRKCQYILSFMAMSFLSPSSHYSGRSGGAGMWRNSSLSPDRFFSLSQIRTHIAIQKNESGREWQKTVEKKRFWKKSWPFMDVVTSSFAFLALSFTPSFSCLSHSWWSNFHEGGTPWAWTPNSVIKRKRLVHVDTALCAS